MEKHTAHYSLEAIQAQVSVRGVACLTRTAQAGAAALGLTMAQALAVVLGLERHMLYKSMTSHADHTVWQDVYHAPCPNGRIAYIKVTLRTDGAVVIQFKEK